MSREVNGIINIKKERGFTSHDVVAKLRGIIGQKKIGHTGTLDPDAEGVLPVCLGRATKVCDMLTNVSKKYETVMLLGVTTDTEDISGNVLTNNEKAAATIDKRTVRDAVMSYVGTYEQTPPMYSALKVNGRRLYELARKGVEVEREPRAVTIYDIVINEIDIPRVRFAVECSKGTYIRTLCKDIGEKIGCGACMERLVRTQVSTFKIEDAVTISEVENLVKNGMLDKVIVPVDSMFSDCAKCVVKEKYNVLIYNGNKFSAENVFAEELLPGEYDGGELFGERARVRVYDEAGNFIGLYERRGREYKPLKMFFDFK